MITNINLLSGMVAPNHAKILCNERRRFFQTSCTRAYRQLVGNGDGAAPVGLRAKCDAMPLKPPALVMATVVELIWTSGDQASCKNSVSLRMSCGRGLRQRCPSCSSSLAPRLSNPRSLSWKSWRTATALSMVDIAIAMYRLRQLIAGSSAVYYFHRSPKSFSGGALRLYSFEASEERGTFVDIEPTNDTLVFFPSWFPHEVRPVVCPSGRFEDSRFAINCWVHR